MTSFWGDSPRWLYETFRIFLGSTPYLDVASPYPPLSLYAFYLPYELFGQTFQSAQVVVDILSLAVILSTYFLLRQFLPPALSTTIAACFAAAGATTEMSFSLFSLNVYTPSVLLASLGLNLLLTGLIRSLRAGRFRVWDVVLAATGSSLSILSRVELMIPLAACLSLVILRLWSSQPRSWVNLLTAALAILGPCGLGLAWLAAAAGLGNVLAGFTSYGSIAGVCPYWPTGIGILGFLAGLGQAFLVYLPGAWLKARTAGVRDRRFLLPALGALAINVVFIYAAWFDLPRFWATARQYSPNEHYSAAQTVLSMVSLTHLLVGVMSVTVILTVRTVFRAVLAMFHGRNLDGIVTAEAVLSAAGAALCVRSLFGGLWTEIPTVSPIAYATLFAAAAVLLARVWDSPAHAHPTRPPNTDNGRLIRAEKWAGFAPHHVLLSLLFLSYAAGRLAWTYGLQPPERYYPLETLAGPVLLKDESSLSVYHFVISHTQPADLVADFGYGGGVNFAARRSSPLFMTMFSMVRPPERYLQLDVERMRIAKPKLAIGLDDDLLGSRYGGWTTNGCMFPALVWRSTRMTGDPRRVLPVIAYARETYTAVLQTGGRRVLLRNDLVGGALSGAR